MLLRLRPRHLIERQWAALVMDLEDPAGLERAFREYVAIRGFDWDVERTWPRLVELSRAMIAGTARR